MTLAILQPKPLSTRLWQVTGLLGVWMVALLAANFLLPAKSGVSGSMLGHDFLAFYSAGAAVNDGRPGELYDLSALYRRQLGIAASAHLGAEEVAPFWNPPIVAWLFGPLARLPFSTALLIWTGINVASVTLSSLVLARSLPKSATRKHRALIPALLLVAFPTLQFLGHGQNTGVTLLLLSVIAWTFVARRPIVAGVVLALLCYKPQHAAIVGVALALTMGWRVLLGAVPTLAALVLATVMLMPGSLQDYAQQMPANLHAIQFERPYLWDRHVTLTAFWRLLFQGQAVGIHDPLTAVVSTLSTFAMLGLLFFAWLRVRVESLSKTKLLALAMLATPLVVPFYFDYDLLLLAVPAVLVAREAIAADEVSRFDRRFAWAGVALLIWSMLNVHVAGLMHVNGTVLILCGIAILFVTSRRRAVPQIDADRDFMLGFDDLQSPPRRAA